MGVRKNDPDATRSRIVDAAFLAFTREGYGATAVHDLQARAGVTGGALAHHFPSKKALGLAVIRSRVAEAVEETWIRPVERAVDARAGLLAAFERVIDDLDRRMIAGCPLTNLALELAGQDEELRGAADAVFARWRSALAAKLTSDLDAGRVTGVDPDGLATLIVAAISGSLAMAKAAQRVEPLSRCREELAGMLDRIYAS